MRRNIDDAVDAAWARVKADPTDQAAWAALKEATDAAAAEMRPDAAECEQNVEK